MFRGLLVATVLLAAGCRRHHQVLDVDAGSPRVPIAPPGQAMATQGQGVGLMVPPPVTAPPDDPTLPVPPPGVMRVLPNTP